MTSDVTHLRTLPERLNKRIKHRTNPHELGESRSEQGGPWQFD